MKGPFTLRAIGILSFMFIILQSVNTNLVITFSQESSLDSLQNSLLQPMNSHNMTQMMEIVRLEKAVLFYLNQYNLLILQKN